MLTRDVVAWALAVSIAGVAIVRTCTAAPPSGGVAASDKTARLAFRKITLAERSMRRDAGQKFPADAWSQDDDFHRSERLRALEIARDEGVRFSDVLRAIDDGMRGGWPLPAYVTFSATVPPCHPRLDY